MIMKTTNIIKAFSWLCGTLFLLSACNNDGDLIYISSPSSSELMASKSEIVLLQENASQIAVSFSWTESTVTISDENVGVADSQLTYYLEAATTEDFSSDIGESQVTNLRKDYTVAELNTLATNIGVQPDVAQTVYFRLGVTTGSNMERVYGNVTTIKVTTYEIDMTIGYILGTDSEDQPADRTGETLSSPNADGIYTGFIGAVSWKNFYFEEGDGTIWGNNGVTGVAFEASSANSKEDRWNFWFPGTGGCYYTIIDTQKEEWSALLLPTLSISGDINDEMEYDRANNRWTYIFDATSTNSLNIRLSTTGKQYNVSTGATDTSIPIDTPVSFVQDGDKLELATSAGTLNVSVPEIGESTLILDLSDPDNYTCTIVSGAEVIEDIPEYLYLPGIDGSWGFNNYLTLYDEENRRYAGVIDVDSDEWGYQILIEEENWDDKYGWETGDPYSGTIIYKDGENMPVPVPGIYLIDISTKELTYELVPLENQLYIVGLNDDWGFDTQLTQTSQTGVYSGQITIDDASSWGFQILLYYDDWDHIYGGSSGKLYYNGSNITDDADLPPGTYTMTVDLINVTYRIE